MQTLSARVEPGFVVCQRCDAGHSQLLPPRLEDWDTKVPASLGRGQGKQCRGVNLHVCAHTELRAVDHKGPTDSNTITPEEKAFKFEILPFRILSLKYSGQSICTNL